MKLLFLMLFVLVGCEENMKSDIETAALSGVDGAPAQYHDEEILIDESVEIIEEAQFLISELPENQYYQSACFYNGEYYEYHTLNTGITTNDHRYINYYVTYSILDDCAPINEHHRLYIRYIVDHGELSYDYTIWTAMAEWYTDSSDRGCGQETVSAGIPYYMVADCSHSWENTELIIEENEDSIVINGIELI